MCEFLALTVLTVYLQWFLERAWGKLAEKGFLFKGLCDSRKIHHQTGEFHVKFHLKNRYRTHRFAIRAIWVFRVKFDVEFTSQVVDFPIELLLSGLKNFNVGSIQNLF